MRFVSHDSVEENNPFVFIRVLQRDRLNRIRERGLKRGTAKHNCKAKKIHAGCLEAGEPGKLRAQTVTQESWEVRAGCKFQNLQFVFAKEEKGLPGKRMLTLLLPCHLPSESSPKQGMPTHIEGVAFLPCPQTPSLL